MPDPITTLPPVDMDKIKDAAFWRMIIVLAAFVTCLSPILLGVRV